MEEIIDIRERIYNYFHSSSKCQDYFFNPSHEAEYVAYYNSMYLLQDTTESLWSHRQKDFSDNSFIAYIEIWGILQAVTIQQDAIDEIYETIIGKKLSHKGKTAWGEIRAFRHICAGHPVKKDLPKSEPLTRSFIGRSFGGYDGIVYEKWQQGSGTTHPCIKLGILLDKYTIEAKSFLNTVLLAMKKQWPL